MKTLSRETNTITIATFWENHLLNKYNYSPPYQRRSLWSDEKKSFLIDSILNNFPIPPIFLHQKIDTNTGKTQYDVIDGKQRLDSIIQFISNNIPSASESASEFSEDIAGAFFEDLEGEKLAPYKRHFWKYSIPIEYIDSQDPAVIDDIFDRLNRNGEALKGQELRNSKYYNSALLKLVSKLSRTPFWQTRLEHLDASRMEDLEFVSELVFELLEGEPLAANQNILDEMYEKYSSTEDFEKPETLFISVTEFMRSLDLSYSDYRIGVVSHLYGLWCFSHKCLESDIKPNDVSHKVGEFFKELRSMDIVDNDVVSYKRSMSSRTKSEFQRRLRLNSLWKFVNS
jgi:hypothetical protein